MIIKSPLGKAEPFRTSGGMPAVRAARSRRARTPALQSETRFRLQLQSTRIIDIQRLASSKDRNDDSQTNRSFRRRDRHYNKDK